MKTYFCIELQGDPDAVSARLAAHGVKHIRKLKGFSTSKSTWVEFVATEAVRQIIINEEQMSGTPISWRLEREYDDADLDVPMLNMSFDVKPLSVGHYGTPLEYDFCVACSECWSGAQLVSPFWIEERHVPSLRARIAQTVYHDLLLSEHLVDILHKINPAINGDLRNVVVSGTRCACPWRLLDPRVVLPRMRSDTTGIIRGLDRNDMPCQKCLRDGHFHSLRTPFEPRYNKSDVIGCIPDNIQTSDGVPDLSVSWECFGIGRRMGPGFSREAVARPLVFVSRRVCQLLRREKIRGLRWTPVVLI